MSDYVRKPPQTTASPKKPLHTRHSLRVIASVVALCAIGVGSFAIAANLTSSSTPDAARVPASAPPIRGPLPRGAGGTIRPAAGTVGTVTSIQPKSFKLKERNSTTTLTVVISPSTTFREQGKSSATYGNVAVGGLVAVQGKTSGLKLFATAVVIVPSDAVGPGAGFGGGITSRGNFGTVQSVATNSFVIATRTGSTITVKVTASTVFTDRSSDTPTFSDIEVGDLVIVLGVTSGSTVTASSVFIVPTGGFGGGFGGPPAGGGSSGSTTTPAS